MWVLLVVKNFLDYSVKGDLGLEQMGGCFSTWEAISNKLGWGGGIQHFKSTFSLKPKRRFLKILTALPCLLQNQSWGQVAGPNGPILYA